MNLAGIIAVGMNLHLLQYSSDKSLEALTHLEVPRHLESNPLGSALVFCLESKVKGHLIPLRLIGSFFDFLPARLGRNAALDAAVSCLCAIYRGEPSPSGNFHQSVYHGYVGALSSLRSCLGDVSLRMESETLCASILLHMCEVSFESFLIIKPLADYNTLFSLLSMLIEEGGVNLQVEPLFSFIPVGWTDIEVLLIMQYWSLSWDLLYVMQTL